MEKKEFIVLHKNDTVHYYDDHVVVVEAFNREDALVEYAKKIYSKDETLLEVVKERVFADKSAWKACEPKTQRKKEENKKGGVTAKDLAAAHRVYRKVIRKHLGVDRDVAMQIHKYFTRKIEFEDLSSEIIDFISLKEVQDNIENIKIIVLDDCRL